MQEIPPQKISAQKTSLQKIPHAPIRLYPANEAVTGALGHILARWLQPGDLVLLNGDLGTGKSTLARACIQSMLHEDGHAYAEEVPSPTFTLVQTYERKIATVRHFDLYRLGDPDELYDLGFHEAVADGICLIEWPERLGDSVPEKHLQIDLYHPCPNPAALNSGDNIRDICLWFSGIDPARIKHLTGLTGKLMNQNP